MTSKERRDLARLMWKCKSMSDPDIRNGIVTDLEGEFNTSITRNRSNDLADIRHIIDACEYFNNFASLIDAMKFFDQDAPSMLAVEKFLQARLS